MAERVEILGIYDRGKKAAVCAGAILDKGLGDVVTYSPVPDRALDQALHVTLSPVRLFVLIGGLLGCATGFIFPIYTVLDWPLITGGKPLLSIPPMTIIMYENTMLGAIIFTVLGVLFESRLPKLNLGLYDERITEGYIGITVTADPDRVGKAEESANGSS